MLKSLIPNIKFLRKIVFVTFSIAFIFSSGYIFGYQGYSVRAQKFPSVNIVREVPANKGTLDFDLFWKVWDTLESKYFDKSKVIPAKMVYGAISGMVSALGDPYTMYLPPKENMVVIFFMFSAKYSFLFLKPNPCFSIFTEILSISIISLSYTYSRVSWNLL